MPVYWNHTEGSSGSEGAYATHLATSVSENQSAEDPLHSTSIPEDQQLLQVMIHIIK